MALLEHTDEVANELKVSDGMVKWYLISNETVNQT